MRLFALGQRDQRLGVGDVEGERLLDVHVLPRLEEQPGQRRVRRGRAAMTTASSPGTSSSRRASSTAVACGTTPRAFARRRGVGVADGDDPGLGQGREVAQEVRAPVAGADEGEVDGFHGGLREGRLGPRVRRPKCSCRKSICQKVGPPWQAGDFSPVPPRGPRRNPPPRPARPSCARRSRAPARSPAGPAPWPRRPCSAPPAWPRRAPRRPRRSGCPAGCRPRGTWRARTRS